MPFSADSYASGDLPPFLDKTGRENMISGGEHFYVSEVRYDDKNAYQGRPSPRWLLRIHVPTPEAAPFALSLGADGVNGEDRRRKDLFDAMRDYLADESSDADGTGGWGRCAGPFVLTRTGAYMIVKDAPEAPEEAELPAVQPKRSRGKKATETPTETPVTEVDPSEVPF